MAPHRCRSPSNFMRWRDKSVQRKPRPGSSRKNRLWLANATKPRLQGVAFFLHKLGHFGFNGQLSSDR
jgi:hypothetical protein